MSDQTWYRGEAVAGPVSTPGGAIHDFGDGLYLTDRVDVARLYAEGRAPKQPDKQAVLVANFDPKILGNVHDLRTDLRWKEFFKKDPMGEQAFEIIKSGRVNEMYGKAFESFLKENKINREQFDAIIGPEYVRGGMQICIVYKNGKPTALASKIRDLLKPVGHRSSDSPGAGMKAKGHGGGLAARRWDSRDHPLARVGAPEHQRSAGSRIFERQHRKRPKPRRSTQGVEGKNAVAGGRSQRLAGSGAIRVGPPAVRGGKGLVQLTAGLGGDGAFDVEM